MLELSRTRIEQIAEQCKDLKAAIMRVRVQLNTMGAPTLDY